MTHLHFLPHPTGALYQNCVHYRDIEFQKACLRHEVGGHMRAT